MLSEQKTPELAQAYSLGQAYSLTASARLEPASYRDLRALADGLEASSRAPGLGEAERIRLQIEAGHAQLVALKINPHKSRKAKRFSARRLKERISRLHLKQVDTGFELNGYRVGSSSWSQYDVDNRLGSNGLARSRESRS